MSHETFDLRIGVGKPAATGTGEINTDNNDVPAAITRDRQSSSNRPLFEYMFPLALGVFSRLENGFYV